MKLLPHHEDGDNYGRREYRSADGAWRVVRPRFGRTERPRWEVHERRREARAGWHRHAAFERRRDALAFLDTTAAAPAGRERNDSARQAAPAPESSPEPPQGRSRRPASWRRPRNGSSV